jgi:hypothetical protein
MGYFASFASGTAASVARAALGDAAEARDLRQTDVAMRTVAVRL